MGTSPPTKAPTPQPTRAPPSGQDSSSNTPTVLQIVVPRPTCSNPDGCSEHREVDPATYCSGETTTGHPCLPELLLHLGSGFNAMTGQRTERVIHLPFTQGKKFSIRNTNTTYEIPDNVDCQDISSSTSTMSMESFQSTLSFRRDIGASFGVAGGSWHSPFFAFSADYKRVIEGGFGEENILYRSRMQVGVYKCKLLESREKVVVSHVQSEINREREDIVEKVTGTHYIDSFTSGGKITVFIYVNNCVSNSSTSTEIRSSLRVLFSKLAAAAEGEVSEVTECSVLSENSYFSTVAVGGDQSMTSNQNLWISSVPKSPTAVEFTISLPLLRPLTRTLPRHVRHTKTC